MIVGEEPGQEDDDDSPAPNPKLVSPAENFLPKGPNDLWTLGPPPTEKVLRADLGSALHTYLTQQWHMYVFYLILEIAITQYFQNCNEEANKFPGWILED